MRAALLFGPRDLRVVEIARPAPAADDVVVRVVRFAPYGTDVELYRAEDGRHRPEYPVGIGADFSGIVEAVGTAVLGFAPGDRVTALALGHCGHCRFCREGRTNLCPQAPVGREGRQEACQEFALVKANKLAKIPPGVSFDDAAMLAGLVTALNSYERLQPRQGETIVVLGTGVMAWGAIALGRLAGCRVVAAGVGPYRTGLARQLGAHDVVCLDQRNEDALDRLRALVPEGADCVVETTTSDWGLRHALAVAGQGGRVAVIGGGALPTTAWQLVSREIAVVGVKAGHQQDQALQLLAKGLVDLKPTISRRLPLERAPEAFATLAGPDAFRHGRFMIEVTEP